MGKSLLYGLSLLWLSFIMPITGCAKPVTADFPFFTEEGQALPLLTTQTGKSGLLTPGSSLSYRLEKHLSPGADFSLALTYRILVDDEEAPEAGPPELTILLSPIGETEKNDPVPVVQWQLPVSGEFIGFSHSGGSYRIQYAIPLGNQEFSGIKMEFQKPEQRTKPGLSVILEKVALVPLWFGFSVQEQELNCTPFVALKDGVYSIDIPDSLNISGSWELEITAESLSAPVSLRTGREKAGGFSILSPVIPVLMAGSLPENPFPLILSDTNNYTGVSLRLCPVASLREKPIPADPVSMLDYRQDLWRNKDYEVFQWDRFPGILFFDTRSYEVQDRLFKRLAFYVEKAGYRGRLASDAEIASLHGWNAHDYRSVDLADFFSTAEKTGFQLNREEVELRDLLQAQGLIIPDNGEGRPKYKAGQGALISISRESEGYLRRLLMVHETFHALFFIDVLFQSFAEERWNQLDPVARRFILAYFKNRGYDTTDAFLMKNELMAYCLQQPVASAALYFGKTIPARLSAYSQYERSLPEKDEKSGTWPKLASLFTAEAKAFSDYVQNRWGLEAGRVWTLTKRPL